MGQSQDPGSRVARSLVGQEVFRVRTRTQLGHRALPYDGAKDWMQEVEGTLHMQTRGVGAGQTGSLWAEYGY